MRDLLEKVRESPPRTLSLPPAFFKRSALEVAPDLIGSVLCRKWGNEVWRDWIVEVEAYDGFEDRASHASRGETPRNSVMFGPPGCWYVYLCYGMHWLLNVSCGPRGYPAAVLVRGLAGVAGPGRLTRRWGVDGEVNGAPARPGSGLWIESGLAVAERQELPVQRSPRVGVSYAGPIWAAKPYRWSFS